MYFKWIPLFREMEKAPQQFGPGLNKLKSNIAEGKLIIGL
jgi:hypothetical protein